MSCKRLSDMLPAFANGELSDDSACSQVEAHVAACPRCANELAAFRTMREWVHGAREAPLGETTVEWSGVKAAIVDRQLAKRRRAGFGRLGLAAACLAVLAIAFWPRAADPTPPAEPDMVAKVQPEAVSKAETHVHPPKPTPIRLAETPKQNPRRAPRARLALATPKVDAPVVKTTGDEAPIRSALLSVELSPNAMTGNVEASVMSKHDQSFVIEL